MPHPDVTEVTDPAPESKTQHNWAWLLDLARALALAIGQCLGGMLQGPPPSAQEKTAEFWLSNPLLRNGLEMDFEQLGNTAAHVLTKSFTKLLLKNGGKLHLCLSSVLQIGTTFFSWKCG